MSFTKGMVILKQAVVSMIVVLLAAGILAGMVLYSVSVMRQVQMKILTGEYIAASEPSQEKFITLYSD